VLESGLEDGDGVAMDALSAHLGWWKSLLRRGGAARGDLAGGLTAALVLPTIEGGYGMIAFAPLGPEQAQMGFLLGAMAAAVACIVTFLAGGRGPQLSGSSAALALLLPALFTTLMADPHFLTADGRPAVALLLAFAAVGVTLAGVLQVGVASLKLGKLARYVPYPVHAGYMDGSAVLIVGAMAPHFIGLPIAKAAVDPGLAHPLAPVIAVVAMWLALRPPSWTRRVPPYLTALLGATGLHHLLALTPLADWLGPLFAAPEFHWPTLDVMAPLADQLRDGLQGRTVWSVLLFAAVIAIMSTLQTVLAASTVDELIHERRDGDRELFASGLANVAVGIMGAPPCSGSTTRSVIALDAGSKTGASRMIFGISMLLALAYGLQYMILVPMAAIAGALIAAAFSLVDAWTQRATAVLWRQLRHGHVSRSLAQSYAIMLVVAGVTVFVSLPLAIVLGTLIAMLMFIRSNTRKPIRQVVHADRRSSRTVRPAAQAELLRRHGRRIALLELDGALFFGTADAADEEIERLAHSSDQIIVDLERVSDVDASGARVLLHAAEAVHRAGKHLLFAGLSPRDARFRMIREMDVHSHLADAQFFPDADAALEHAEDRLLATLLPAQSEHHSLRLEETQLATLASLMTERRVSKGEAIFRRGDPGDAMYVSLQGQVGIWLPADPDKADRGRARRMVSYAPGVVFGEIGLLQGNVRSADAVAEDDVVVLELPRTGYERLVAEHPVLLSKLLLNVGLLLSSRIRALTDELEAAQAVR
jgi:SulP family sulfate permease